MAFRNDQDVPRFRAGVLHSGLDSLNHQRIENMIEVVEARRKQIGVHRCEFEARISQIDRSIEGCGVF